MKSYWMVIVISLFLFFGCNSDNVSVIPAPVPTYSLKFDGATGHVDVVSDSSLVMTTGMTMEAWVKSNGNGDGAHYDFILAKYGEYELAVYKDRSVQFAINAPNPGWTWTNTGYILPDSVWTHLAVTYSTSSQEFIFYVNGDSVFARSASGNIIPDSFTPDAFTLGNSSILDGSFKGAIDEVRIWNVALDRATIHSWMQKTIDHTHPDVGNLRAYWRFEEGTGTQTQDASGYNHAGTLHSGVQWSAGHPLN